MFTVYVQSKPTIAMSSIGSFGAGVLGIVPALTQQQTNGYVSLKSASPSLVMHVANQMSDNFRLQAKHLLTLFVVTLHGVFYHSLPFLPSSPIIHFPLGFLGPASMLQAAILTLLHLILELSEVTTSRSSEEL
jgi:hypothetical protein